MNLSSRLSRIEQSMHRTAASSYCSTCSNGGRLLFIGAYPDGTEVIEAGEWVDESRRCRQCGGAVPYVRELCGRGIVEADFYI